MTFYNYNKKKQFVVRRKHFRRNPKDWRNAFYVPVHTLWNLGEGSKVSVLVSNRYSLESTMKGVYCRLLGCTVMGVGVLKAVGAIGESGGEWVSSASRSATSSSSMMEMSRMDGRCERRQPARKEVIQTKRKTLKCFEKGLKIVEVQNMCNLE